MGKVAAATACEIWLFRSAENVLEPLKYVLAVDADELVALVAIENQKTKIKSEEGRSALRDAALSGLEGEI
jgi:hypothetical protein